MEELFRQRIEKENFSEDEKNLILQNIFLFGHIYYMGINDSLIASE